MQYIRNTRLGTFLFVFIVGAIVNMLLFKFVLESKIPASPIIMVSAGVALAFAAMTKKPLL